MREFLNTDRCIMLGKVPRGRRDVVVLLNRLGDRWVLVESGGGGSQQVRYRSGSFDPEAIQFRVAAEGIVDHAYGPKRPDDASRGFYGTNLVTAPDGRVVLFGWAGRFKPGRGWNCCMGLARELSLDDAGRLLQSSARQLERLRRAVVAFAAAGFFAPGLFTWRWRGYEPRQAIVPLVQLTMLGMGLTLTATDFRRVLATPVVVALGVAAQFGIMPLAGWTFTRLFGLTGEVAAGLILVGSCPGGVASNVITYVARANVPLSVTLTACTTLLSPLVTPLAMRLLAGRDVPIDAGEMFWSIVWVILAPVVAGVVVNRFAPGLARRLASILPPIAMAAICVIIAITVALAAADLRRVGLPLFAAAVCHNATGFLLGYFAARAARLDVRDARKARGRCRTAAARQCARPNGRPARVRRA